MLPEGSWTEYQKFEHTNYTILAGLPPVDCGEVPPEDCFLAITGITGTNVTVRGDDDGSIYVGTTGATGTTTWYLNGEFILSGGSDSYTFTGLTAGVYDVLVVDGNDCIDSYEDLVIIDGDFRTGDFTVTYPSDTSGNTVLVAVENPIIIGVSTAINNPNPLPNITTITVSGTVANNTSIQFNLTSPYEYSQTFYSKAYPYKPNFFLASVLNNQYGVAVGTNTNTEIATSLAEALQKDAVIPKVYYINNDDTVVTLTAKETGSRFDLTSTNVVASATGLTVTQTQAGVDYCDGQIIDNYSISCEVLVNTDETNQYPDTGDTGDYNRIAELILPFNPTNQHRFDISSILKSQVNTPMPWTSLTGSTYLASCMQPYFTKLSELYPLVQNTNTIKKRYKTETPVQWVINSALSRYEVNNMEDYVTVPVKFLTNSPSPKQIQRNSNEFLYFVIPKNYGADLTCEGDMYFYDGTSVTGVTFFTISTGTTNAGGVMCMNLSYSKLGLAAYEVTGTTNRKIKRIEVAIYASGGTTQYSQKKQYRFEIDEMPRKWGILFQNKLGMYDAVDFIGVVEETISRDADNYTVPLTFGTQGNLVDGFKNTATYNTKIVKKVIANTGWIDETHFDWLMELMNSNNIYSTSTTNQNYLNLVEYSYKKSSLDDLFSIEATFEWTIYENNLTI